jgi:hypothetical protein
MLVYNVRNTIWLLLFNSRTVWCKQCQSWLHIFQLFWFLFHNICSTPFRRANGRACWHENKQIIFTILRTEIQNTTLNWLFKILTMAHLTKRAFISTQKQYRTLIWRPCGPRTATLRTSTYYTDMGWEWTECVASQWREQWYAVGTVLVSAGLGVGQATWKVETEWWMYRSAHGRESAFKPILKRTIIH